MMPDPTVSGIAQYGMKVGAGDNNNRSIGKEALDRSIFMPSFMVKGKQFSSSYKPKSMYCLTMQISFVLCTLLLAHVLRRTLKPIIRGFFSCDQSIRLPYHESTYPYLPMLIICLLLTFLIIVVTETLYYLGLDRKIVRYRYDLFSPCGYTIHPVVTRMIQFMLLVLFGFSLNTIVVSILKNSLGHLRPNFISVCRPNNVNVTDDCRSNNFIDNYECINPTADADFLQDTHLSFPSGHTATAFYFAVFAIIYMHFRLSRHIPDGRLIILFFQWALLVLAAKIGLSRISDHKHHASDVMFGALFGSAIAASVLFVHDQFLEGVARRPSLTECPSNTKEDGPSASYEVPPARQEMSSV